MAKTGKYDAFISYRHCEPDNEIASRLQKKLESFRFPKDIADKVGRTKLSRIFRDETIEADDRAFLLKVRDAVTAAADQTIFERIVGQMREATEAKIPAITAPKVVELTSSRFGISINENEGVLGHLIDGGDLSLYGMANAVTRYAQDVKSYDRSTELEATGYKILTMAPALWNSILSTARKEV